MRITCLLLLCYCCLLGGCAFDPQSRPTSWTDVSEENLIRYVRESPFVDVQKEAVSELKREKVLYELAVDSSVNKDVRTKILRRPLGEGCMMNVLASQTLDAEQQILALKQIKTETNLIRLMTFPIADSAKRWILSRPLSEDIMLKLLMMNSLAPSLQKLALERVKSEKGLRNVVWASHLHIETRKVALMALSKDVIEEMFDSWQGDLAMFCLLLSKMQRSKQVADFTQLKLLDYWKSASVLDRREMIKWFRDDTELLDGISEQMNLAEVIKCYDSPILRKRLESLLIDDRALVYLVKNANVDLSKWAVSRIENTRVLKLCVEISNNPIVQSYIISLFPEEDIGWFKSLLSHPNEFVRKTAYERIKLNETLLEETSFEAQID